VTHSRAAELKPLGRNDQRKMVDMKMGKLGREYMGYKVLEDTPYGGQIHILTEPANLERLPIAGQKLLNAYQLAQFQGFPDSLLALAETTKLSYLAQWLNTLAQATECQLEVCLTEYADPIVLLRYKLTEKWHPALSFQSTYGLASKIPLLLREVYDVIGRVNFDGYGYAGGVLYPPDRYPDLGSYCEWRDENMPDYKGYMCFYESWTGDKLLVNVNGQVGWYVHDDASACRLIGNVDDVLSMLFDKLNHGMPLEPRDM
jgi:hypothetical protein